MSLKGLFREFVRHPLAVTMNAVFYGGQFALHGAGRLSEELRYAANSVASFSPPATPPPHWQDLLFGEGRAQKLLDLLEGIPHIKPRHQKELMENSSGISIVPENLELVQYGLNDNILEGLFGDLDHNIFETEALGGSRKNPDSVLLDPKKGCIDPESHQDLGEFSDRILTTAYFNWTLADYYHQALDEYVSDDPIHQQPYPTERIREAVLDWAVRDVLPAVPNIVEGYLAEQNDDGTVTLKKADNRVPRYHGANPEFYYHLRKAYKGKLPDYDAKLPDQAPTAPAPL